MIKTGDRFNYLTAITDQYRVNVVSKSGKSRSVTKAKFRCDCGVEKEIQTNSVKSGTTKSCGCYNRLAAAQRISEANRKYTPGITDHTLYQSWKSMRARCNIETHPDYLEGISYPNEWDDYEIFYNWAISIWEKGRVLSRIDSSKDFSEENCFFDTHTNIGLKNHNHEKTKETWMKKYGVDHTKKVPEIVEKTKQTNIKKYGAEYPFQSEEIREKIKETNLEKYGTEHASQSEIVKEQTKINNMKKYGVEYPQQLQLVKDKIEHTNLKKYGFKSTAQHPETKEKIKESLLKNYGVDTPFKSEEIKEKAKQTLLENYGVESPSLHPEIRKKQIDTMVEKYGRPYPKPTGQEELEVKDWINSLGFNFESDMSVLGGKEIDLFDPTLNIGIEYCGVFWHCEKYQSDKNYHYNKYKACKDQGIRLITIFSHEWQERQDQVKGFVKSVVGANSNRVFARKCDIFELDPNIGQEFIHKYHIQGQKRKARVYFGLVYSGEIIAAISFNVHHRNKHQIALDRLCFRENFSVVGGSSKLLKYGTSWCKNEGYDRIISWSDNRWSYGDVYRATGFKLECELNPDYMYTDINKKHSIVSKQSMKKSNTGCPKHITERNWCIERGLYRIWDCGKLRWVKYI